MVGKVLRDGVGLRGMGPPSSHCSGFLKGDRKGLVFHVCSYLSRALGGAEKPAGASKLLQPGVEEPSSLMSCKGQQRKWARRERRGAGLWALNKVQDLKVLYLHMFHTTTLEAGAGYLPARQGSRRLTPSSLPPPPGSSLCPARIYFETFFFFF